MKVETHIAAGDARGRFDRLCDHFRNDHDFQVDHDGGRAEIVLPDGWCAVRITDTGLHLILKTWDLAALEPMKAFFTRHIQRLVLQSRLPVVWTHALGADVDPDDIPAAKLRMLAAALDQTVPDIRRG